jgi:protein SCO1/2
MRQTATIGALTETEFAAMVDALAADAERRAELIDLLREEHALYDQRGAATIVRMRGWVLLALARVGVDDAALLYVLEELDTSADAYLVAAAARALRSYIRPVAEFNPFVMHALTNIGNRDEPVCFDRYGEYAVSETGTSPIRELLATLAWLGPAARGVLPELEALRNQPGAFSRKVIPDLDRAIAAMVRTEEIAELGCCELPGGLRNMFSWARSSSSGDEAARKIVFEDHQGEHLSFEQFFRGRPSIVVFFYTRCDNPLKCSLTVTKLGRVQKLLAERGLADQIRTAAITYDPAFDLPERLRGYGERRAMHLDANHRMFRTCDGDIGALRSYFRLGVNFIESLVNRHRVEAHVLDAEGRIAFSFERLRWDEQEVVERAVEMLERESGCALSSSPRRRNASLALGTFASVALAFFPKCPICWATYLSVIGIAGLEQISYLVWLKPFLFLALLINVAGTWLRGRSTGQTAGAYLATAGAAAIALSMMGWASAAGWGVALTLLGSLLSTFGRREQTMARVGPPAAATELIRRYL